jgi:hypothetical protein
MPHISSPSPISRSPRSRANAFLPSISSHTSFQSPSSTPPIPAPPRRKHLCDFDAGHFTCEAASSTAPAAVAVGARCGRRDGRFVTVDVLAVDILCARDPCAALVAAGVALLEAVDFEFGAEGGEEAHCVCCGGGWWGSRRGWCEL